MDINKKEALDKRVQGLNPRTVIIGLILQANDMSDDPNKSVGCAVYLKEKDTFIEGYNRLPEGIKIRDERLERPNKYQWIEHAERDLIYKAASIGASLKGRDMYMTWFPCPDCARAIIASGIKRIYYPDGSCNPESSWANKLITSEEMLLEVGIELIKVKL